MQGVLIMQIAIIGYGKMGKTIERIAQHRGHIIGARIDAQLNNNHLALETLIEHIDVCIDFSHPDLVLDSVNLCARFKKPLVLGTTGWQDKIEYVKKITKESGSALLWSPNFSLGVNLFLRIVKEASILINPFKNYDAAGFEIHHNEKCDSPSGTAIAIANQILNNFERKKRALFESVNRKVENEELQFTSLRVGHAPGTHDVIFDSQNDTIKLTHTARNRDGFAEGAVIAAEWLKDKKGFYTLEDVIDALRSSS